jgi:hypothetical protein
MRLWLIALADAARGRGVVGGQVPSQPSLLAFLRTAAFASLIWCTAFWVMMAGVVALNRRRFAPEHVASFGYREVTMVSLLVGVAFGIWHAYRARQQFYDVLSVSIDSRD